MARPDSKRMLAASVCSAERLLTPISGRFAKASKKATAKTPTNSHRFNAGTGVFEGRQKGGKRQQKATDIPCPKKRKSAAPTRCRREQRLRLDQAQYPAIGHAVLPADQFRSSHCNHDLHT